MAIQAIRNSHLQFLGQGDNLGLSLDKLNKTIDNGNEYIEKDKMLKILVGYRIPEVLYESYHYAFKQWKTVMEQRQQQQQGLTFDIISLNKTLLGFGNASVHEFGLNLNKPWGVPMISGSTLKGLVSAYLSKYGGSDWAKDNNGLKSDYQVELFGGTWEKDNKSYIGSVIFNDIWLYPQRDTWFVSDIITPHHQDYYAGKGLPDGVNDPIPIGIAGLKKGLRFFVSLEGEEQATHWVKSVLNDALLHEGIGAKTAVGYGRFETTLLTVEKSKKILEQINQGNNKDLITLGQQYPRKIEFREAFVAAANKRELRNELCSFYLRFTPLKYICCQLKTNPTLTLKQIIQLFKNNDGTLTNFFNAYPETDKDCDMIFQFILQLPNISTEDIKKHPWLERIAPDWKIILATKTIDQILKEITSKQLIWPPIDTLGKAILESDMDDEDKEIFILELDDITVIRGE